MYNYRQLVIDQLNFKQTFPVPYARLLFAEGVSGKIDLFYGSPDWRNSLHNAIVAFPGIKNDIPASGVFTDEYGVTWRCGTGAKHIEAAPMNRPELKGYNFPDVNQLCPDELLDEIDGNIRKNKNYFSLVNLGVGVFERIWMLRGFENALMDIVAEPAFYKDLVSAIVEHQMEIIDRIVQTCADGVYFSDDWGEQRGVIVGAERWREFIKPNVAKLYAKVHKAGKYVFSHCCGNIAEIIPDCIEMKLDCLQSVQPEAMNPYELKKQFSGKITFWGGLGSQSTVPFGTIDEIKAEIRKLRAEMSKGGGYILGPAKPVLDDTPIENAIAVLDAFNEEYKPSEIIVD